jgi:hypothetical protein
MPMRTWSHLAQLFGIEPRRQRRRTDQVAEHHRQLPALGRRLRLPLSAGWRCRGRRNVILGGAQRPNGSDQPFAVPHRHPKLFEVGVGQLGQDLMVDVVLAEYRCVLFEAELPQPLGDIHRRLPRQRVAG